MVTWAGPASASDAAPHGPGTIRRSRVFAIAWSGGAVLASIALGLLASLPQPQPDGNSIPQWIEHGRPQLTWSGELLFFAVIAWATGAAGTLIPQRHRSPIRTAISLAGLGVALVAFVIALLALGRLVYPVIDINLGSDTLVLIISLISGSIHLALLGLAICAIALPVSPASRRKRAAITACGVLAGVVFVTGSYPWVLPTWLNMAVASLIGVWGILTSIVRIDTRNRRQNGRSR